MFNRNYTLFSEHFVVKHSIQIVNSNKKNSIDLSSINYDIANAEQYNLSYMELLFILYFFCSFNQVHTLILKIRLKLVATLIILKLNNCLF